MASAKNLPMNPTVTKASAITPGKGPRPTADTNTSAHTSSGRARIRLSKSRVSRYASICGVAFLAASTPSGRLMTRAMAVPSTVISRVSSIFASRLGK